MIENFIDLVSIWFVPYPSAFVPFKLQLFRFGSSCIMGFGFGSKMEEDE